MLHNDITHSSEAPLAHRDETLARIIAKWAKDPVGDCVTAIPNLTFFRREVPSPPSFCIIEPSIVLVAQGVKQMCLGGEVYPYDASQFLIASLDMPATSEVVLASPERPCLGLTFMLDLRMLTELIAQCGPSPARDRTANKSVGIGTVTSTILKPLGRLLELLDEPDAIPVLAPLIQREIHYRLLMSDQSTLLRQIASVDAQGHRVAKAIAWLKLNYVLPLRIEEYQKWLRLNEAKRLMLNEHLDAASAAFQVGYESPSQFSREYNRLYGAPPKRDIAALRNTMQSK
jgi:hypothetical protein